MRLKSPLLVLLVTSLVCFASAQKVKVGYDKTVDFSKYRTYSWPKLDPSVQPTLRQLLVMSAIDERLQKAGLTKIAEDGDLIVSGSGGLGGALGGDHFTVAAPSPSSYYYPGQTAWTGSYVASGSMVIEGTLMLQLVDRSNNRAVWQGTVSTKLDNSNQRKNIERVQQAVAKLLDRYPPRK